VVERLQFGVGDAAVVHAAFTDRTDGDMARGVDGSVLASRRSAVAPHPWTWLEQAHGNGVVVVEEPGDAAGSVADAAVTRCPDAVLAVQVADCAPVLMFSAVHGGAVVAAAHAGWRGLLGGVLGSTVDVMRQLGAGDIDWLLGPCITAANYEFSEGDLAVLVDVFGSGVRADTADGEPALDLRCAVRSAMARAGCGGPLEESGTCTTSANHWSHRRSGDAQRQVGAIWWVQC
jgi:YfiH family protein